MSTPAFTLAEKRARLARLVAAETKVLVGQSYTVDGIAYTRANYGELRAAIDKLALEITQEDRGGIRVQRVVLGD